jgi:undecaprenyl diphosphate synthase
MNFLQSKSKLLTQEQLATIDSMRIPQHIAFIPDGNRRWAKMRQFSVEDGHRSGTDGLMDIVRAAEEIGVKVVTFYAFSTENWNRSKTEVHALMLLLQNYLTQQRSSMIENGVRFHTIGDLEPLAPNLIHIIEETKKATAKCDKIDLVLAINYGGRDDICRAFRRIAADCESQKLKKEDITENTISSYLDTHPWNDPDLLIRTGGENRVSNFLLWQISYAEIYLADVLWPDFKPGHLLQAVLNYQQRQRRMGGA